jgi:hypothetical protein
VSRGPATRRADIERAIKAAIASGLTVTGVEAKPGGGIVVLTSNTPASKAVAQDDLAAWREERARRAAQGS